MKFNEMNGVIPAAPATEADIQRDKEKMSKVAAPPIEFIHQTPLVKNQQSSRMCVAFALSSIREVFARKQSFPESWNFSPAYIYANRRGFDPPSEKEGMRIESALKNLIQYGVCFNNTFSELGTYPELEKLLQERKTKADKEAANYKISNYTRVYSRTSVKNSIYGSGPVIASWPMWENFKQDITKNGIVNVPDTYTISGYHAMTILGWKRIENIEYWVVLNSWGTQFAITGICYMPTSVFPYEAWGLRV